MRGRRVLALVASVLLLLTLASWAMRWGGGPMRIGGFDAHDGAICSLSTTFSNGAQQGVTPGFCGFSLTPVFALVLVAFAAGSVLGIVGRQRVAAIVLAAAIPLVLLDAWDGRSSWPATLTALETEAHVAILGVCAGLLWFAGPRDRSLKPEAPALADS